MTHAAALLVLHLGGRLAGVGRRAVFGATAEGGGHLLEVGRGEAGGAIVQPLLRGRRQGGDSSP